MDRGSWPWDGHSSRQSNQEARGQSPVLPPVTLGRDLSGTRSDRATGFLSGTMIDHAWVICQTLMQCHWAAVVPHPHYIWKWLEQRGDFLGRLALSTWPHLVWHYNFISKKTTRTILPLRNGGYFTVLETKQTEQWNGVRSPDHHPASRTCSDSAMEQAVLGEAGPGEASTAMFNVSLPILWEVTINPAKTIPIETNICYKKQWMIIFIVGISCTDVMVWNEFRMRINCFNLGGL